MNTIINKNIKIKESNVIDFKKESKKIKLKKAEKRVIVKAEKLGW